MQSFAKYYGAFTYCGTNYVILKYASHGTLDHFMANNEPPSRASDRGAFYNGVLSLCQAVERFGERGGYYCRYAMLFGDAITNEQ